MLITHTCTAVQATERDNMKIVVFGVGDFAHEASFYFKNDSEYEIEAYTVDSRHRSIENFLGLPVIDFEDIQKMYPPEQYGMFIAVGYHKLNKTREDKFIEAKSKGYQLVSYVSSKNTTWDDLQIGDNCFVMEGNIIQMEVKICDNVFIGMGNKIGHNTVIEENCFVSSNIALGGFCTIRRNTFIGLSATIRDKTVIEENNVLGAGSLILKDTKRDSSYLTAATPRAKVDSRFIANFI
jgi:sugar O-acyltransferase (sialic acid O-acetyltransferase NeuD family)